MTTAASTARWRHAGGRLLRRALPAVGIVLVLTSCTAPPSSSPEALGGGSAPPSAVPAPTLATPTAPATPAASSAPPTDRVAAAVEVALRNLAESQDSITSGQVRTAVDEGFTAAGLVPDAVEVSIDRTPTGLDVDAIQGAGRTGGTCVFGEVREGTVTVVVLPALASGQCFVGDQR